MPLNESPEMCTIASLSNSARVDAFRKAVLLREKVNHLRTTKQPLTTTNDLLLRSWDNIGDDPGVGDPCRDFWALAAAAILDADKCVLGYQVCRQQHPLPGGTVTATAKPEPPTTR